MALLIVALTVHTLGAITSPAYIDQPHVADQVLIAVQQCSQAQVILWLWVPQTADCMFM